MARSRLDFPSDAQGFVDVNLGGTSSSYGFRVYDSAGSLLFAAYGDGTFTPTGYTGTTGTAFTVNSDAAAGSDEDPALRLMGGDGGAEVISSRWKQDSSADLLYLQMDGGAAGATRKSPTLVVGVPGETTVSMDSTLRFEGSSDAGVNRTATIVHRGQERDLTITASNVLVLSDGTASLTMTAGVFTTTGNPTWNFGTGAVIFGGTAWSTTGALAWTLLDNSATALVIGATGDTDMLTLDTTNSNEVVVVGATLGLRLNDSIPLRFGTPGTDLVLTPDGTDVVATSTGDLVFNDSVDVYWGTSKDTGIVHNGTNTVIDHNTGELIFAMGTRALVQDPEIGAELKRLPADSGSTTLDLADGTTTLTLGIPALAKVVAWAANVTEAITGVSAAGVTITLALTGGSTLTLGTLVSAGDGNLAANTKARGMIDPNQAGVTTTNTTQAEVTISGGVDNTPTAGAIRLVVWYETVADLDSV